jgi:nicotinamide-nucleotide adenylyltransferase
MHKRAHRYENDSLMIGRFQPFHNGHLEVIRKISKISDNVTIGIGSAQYSHTFDNPFTAGERYSMISDALKDAKITNAYIVPIEDLNRYSVWISHVESMSPPFSVVYSNNTLTRRLFLEAGYEIKDSPLYNRSEYSGTEVRRRMRCGEDWRSLVPKAVADVIDYIDGIGRIKGLKDDV